jgi:hypothetical protein
VPLVHVANRKSHQRQHKSSQRFVQANLGHGQEEIMIFPIANAKNLGQGKNQFNLGFDSMADFPELQSDYGLDKAAPGSSALCIDTGSVFMLRGDSGDWSVL